MKSDKKHLKRLLAFVLSAAMVLTYMPSSRMTFADTEMATAEVQTEASAEEKKAEPAPAPEPPKEEKAEPAADPAPTPEPQPEPANEEAAEPAATEEATASESAPEGADEEQAADETSAENAEESAETEDEDGLNEETIHFNKSANGIDVSVTAYEGTFPVGTEMKVTAVDSGEVQAAVESAIGEEAAKIKTVDISFWYKGTEKQPNKDVEVKLSSSLVAEDGDVSVVHIKDNGSANVVSDVAFSGTTASFDSGSFSKYALTLSAQEAEETADTDNAEEATTVSVIPVIDGVAQSAVSIPVGSLSSNPLSGDATYGNLTYVKAVIGSDAASANEVIYHVTVRDGQTYVRTNAANVAGIELQSGYNIYLVYSNDKQFNIEYVINPSDAADGDYGVQLVGPSTAMKADGFNVTLDPGSRYTANSIVITDKATGVVIKTYSNPSETTAVSGSDLDDVTGTAIVVTANVTKKTSYKVSFGDMSNVAVSSNNSTWYASNNSNTISQTFTGTAGSDYSFYVHGRKYWSTAEKELSHITVTTLGGKSYNIKIDVGSTTTIADGVTVQVTEGPSTTQSGCSTPVYTVTIKDCYEDIVFSSNFKDTSTVETWMSVLTHIKSAIYGGKTYSSRNLPADKIAGSRTNVTVNATPEDGYYFDGDSAKVVDVQGNEISKTKTIRQGGRTRTITVWSWTVGSNGQSGTLTINENDDDGTYYGIQLEAKPYNYKVVYEMDGGTPEVTDDNSYIYTDSFIIPATIPEKEGYVFTGWKIGSDDALLAPAVTKKIADVEDFTSSGSERTITLTAQWEEKEDSGDAQKVYYTIKVTLKMKDGSTEDIIIEAAYEGKPLLIFEDALRAKVAEDKDVDMSEFDLPDDMQLYFPTLESGQEISVRFDEREYAIDITSASNEVEYDGAEHEAKGYEAHVKIGGKEYPITEWSDGTITFHYTSGKYIDNYYTISGIKTANPKETEPGTYPNTIMATDGTPLPEGTPIAAGTFTIVNSNGTDVTDNTTITPSNGNLVINPVKIVFDKNDADATGETADLEFDKPATADKNLTANGFKKEGYVFAGWNTAADGSGTSYVDKAAVKVSDFTFTDGVATLYAQWEVSDASWTVHHYLLGTTTSVKEDQTGTGTVGTDKFTPVAATEYTDEDGKTHKLKVNNSDAVHEYTISSTASENEVTIYYVIPVTITANDATMEYGDTPKEHYAWTVQEGYENRVGPGSRPVTDATSTSEPGEYDIYFPDVDNPEIMHNYFEVTYVPGTLTITKKQVRVVIQGKHESKVYNGSEQSVTGWEISGISFVNGPTIDNDTRSAIEDAIVGPAQEEAVASGTDAGAGPGAPPAYKTGVYPMRLTEEDFSFEPDDEDLAKKYTVVWSLNDGWLEIKPAVLQVKVTGKNSTVAYTGSEQSVEGFTWAVVGDFTAEQTKGISVTLKAGSEAKASGTNAKGGSGTVADGYPAGAYPMGLTADYFDVAISGNKNFKLPDGEGASAISEVVDGWLDIEPLELTITVKGEQDTLVYNGKEQSIEGYTATSDSDLFDDSKVSYSGDAIAKGRDAMTGDNKYDMDLNVAKFSYGDNNIDATFILEEDGWLKITPLDVTVTITGNSDTVTYNGSSHTVSGYTFNSTSDLFGEGMMNVAGTTSATGTDAGTYNMDITATAKGDPNFNVTVNVTNGKLVINKAVVTVTADDKSKVQGAADPTLTATVSGLVGSDTEDIIQYSLKREAGETPGTYTIYVSAPLSANSVLQALAGNADNYTVKYVNGTFTITAPTVVDDDDDDDGTPVPGGGGDDPVVTPAATPAGPAAAVIPDEPVPQAEPATDIPDEPTPLAEGVWALINLIAAILTAVGAIVALFRRKEEEDEDEEEQTAYKAETEDENEDDNRGKKMLAAKIAGVLAGIAGPVVFLLTEDMSLPMALVDKWTILMVAILAVQIVAAALNKRASKLDDDDEESAEQSAN